MQKFRVGRVGRNKSSPWLWNMASAAAISSGGNPNFGHASTARMHQALMDGEKDQRLVARGREKAGNQHIGIDDRPDHFTPPGVTRSGLRRFSAISASMSAAVRVSSPRRLAPLQAFCSQSGGGAAVRTKSCTLMMTTGGLAASVDDALPDVPPGMV